MHSLPCKLGDCTRTPYYVYFTLDYCCCSKVDLSYYDFHVVIVTRNISCYSNNGFCKNISIERNGLYVISSLAYRQPFALLDNSDDK